MGLVEDMRDQSRRKTGVLRASPPMFDSRTLDALSRVHPAVPVIIFVPAILALGAWALSKQSVAVVVGLAVGGDALWSSESSMRSSAPATRRASVRGSSRATWSTT